ncbi:MAG: D-alanine--D-alanine ligase [Bacteroidales bacterium]|jgi:D-alanine-D-alanine ligase|nr:D-alanine--D-alanine ligase [Bacteroidales bacterium]MCI1732977.1 D-alanine--D-alanine ligase [Bacteroidales bacterium]
MNGKQNVALICGGDSSECEVSVQSAINVAKFIDKEKFQTYMVFLRGTHWLLVLPPDDEEIDVDLVMGRSDRNLETRSKEINKTDFSVLCRHGLVRFDKAFIMIHGKPGENGLLQGYLEMMHVPFTTCSAFVSAITFDKHSCKRFLDYAGVKMAKDVYIRKDVPHSPREIIRQLGLPIFVKPTVGGSSFGVTKVKREEDLEGAINHAYTECDTVIAEEAIEGREVTNGIYKLQGAIHKLPVTEIVTKREYFDYEAKYLGESQEICPAQLSPEMTAKVQNLSERIYTYMGCSGVVRMDYIIRGNDVYFLEVNTIPGMTKMSLIPKQLAVAGLDLKQFLTDMLEDI